MKRSPRSNGDDGILSFVIVERVRVLRTYFEKLNSFSFRSKSHNSTWCQSRMIFVGSHEKSTLRIWGPAILGVV
jgi:hypothetical protein